MLKCPSYSTSLHNLQVEGRTLQRIFPISNSGIAATFRTKPPPPCGLSCILFRPLDTDGGAGLHDDDAGVYWRYRSLLRRAAGNDSFSSQQHYRSPTTMCMQKAPHHPKAKHGQCAVVRRQFARCTWPYATDPQSTPNTEYLPTNAWAFLHRRAQRDAPLQQGRALSAKLMPRPKGCGRLTLKTFWRNTSRRFSLLEFVHITVSSWFLDKYDYFWIIIVKTIS